MRHMTEDDGWTEEDDAALILELLPDAHPARFVDVLRTALVDMDPETVQEILLRGAVTPESAHLWGNFDAARAVFRTGLKISMTPLYGIDSPDVAYVRLVETDAHFSPDITSVPATLHATLVWRPEIAVMPGTSWRIHALGEPIPPSELPRSSAGIDPRDTY
jgi:hypothetical protein